MSANFNFTSDSDLVGDFVDGAKPMSRAPASTAPDEPHLRALAPLSYDFDIVPVAPDAAQQAHLDALAALGQEVDEINVEARWRDPMTARAMAQTSRGVRELFATAGFGPSASNVQMPAGRFPAEDADARHAIVMRLTNALAEANAAAFDWGQIDIAAFFKAQAEATSVRTKPVVQAANVGPSGKRKIALIGLASGIALLVIAGLSAL